MVPSGDHPRIPFPGSNDRPLADNLAPRSVSDIKSEDDQAAGRLDMDVDEVGSTPTKRLPSIQNLFGIAREEPLPGVLRTRTGTIPIPESADQDTLAPNSPTASHSSTMSRSPADEQNVRSLGTFQSSSQPGPSSSLGPIRTKHSSNASPYGRGNPVPSTPPRHTRGAASLTFSPEDAGLRRVNSRSRQAQSLKGLILSPPTRRLPLDYDNHNEPSQPPQRRSGHRPASSSSGSLSTMFSHISTSSDPAPMLPPGYPSSTQTSLESVPYEGWGTSSAHSGSTSPRTSWHSRSSTLESAESAYKMTGPDRGPPSLLPPFRDPMHHSGDPPFINPADRSQSSLSRHRSLRTPGVTANLPTSQQRPRARTLTHADRPIAPLPNSEDPTRRQKLEAASELLRMGQQHPEGYNSSLGGRQYTHKHSSSMQERAPLPAEYYENSNIVRSHRPKSLSLSVRDPAELGRPMPPPGMYYSGPGMPPYDRNMPSASSMDSLHPHRPRGAADNSNRTPPGGAGWVFPRRPVSAESADAQRNAFQAQFLRGHGLASVPDGIIPGQPGLGGSSRNAGTSGTIASGQAKYECAWCGKRFSRPSSLKIHHHSHTGEKPFVCHEPGCGRSFSVQSNLRRHQKCHTPGGESSEAGPGRSQLGPAAVRPDEAIWNRGPPPPAPSSGSRMSPVSAGPSGWHPQYGRSHGHAHSRSLGQMPTKDHPPLSRSAYEPGSHSMATWSERVHEPGMRDDENRWQTYDRTASPRRFTQMRERGLSSSSNEEDELEYEEAEAAAARAAAVAGAGPNAESTGIVMPKDELVSPQSGEDEDYDRTITNTEPEPQLQTRRRSATSSSTTSGLRVGFGSLLNPSTQEPASTDEPTS